MILNLQIMIIKYYQRKQNLEKNWITFLKNSKFVFGTQSGVSLLDEDGKIKKAVINFKNNKPNSTFSEIEEFCFPDLDFNVHYFMLSPRNFESMLCKTLQILVEGDYNNVLKPNEHYLELKKDFSNLEEIYKMTQNIDFCQNLVDNAKESILNNEKLYYDYYVKMIMSEIRSKINSIKNQKRANYKFENFIYFIFNSRRKLLGEIRVNVKFILMTIFPKKLIYFVFRNQIKNKL